ncbi:transposase [uncultured Amphritea sp.]|uniref:transposase n=1 Tax=uncultured Amphritea sp. TaxID=981605 RepID=UPI00343FCE34
MSRIHCMQHGHYSSDPTIENTLYEIASMNLFAGLSLDKATPYHSTILKFLPILECHGNH